jgi:hypothetical protein
MHFLDFKTLRDADYYTFQSDRYSGTFFCFIMGSTSHKKRNQTGTGEELQKDISGPIA